MQLDTSVKAMREFGLVTGALIIGLFGLFIPWLWDVNLSQWLSHAGAIGGGLIIWALIHPASLRWVYRPWMKFATILGIINTHIILFLLFFLLFMPMGLVMRLFGKDPMQRQFQKQQASYRHTREPPTKDHMETPY